MTERIRAAVEKNPRKMTLQLARDLGVPEVEVIAQSSIRLLADLISPDELFVLLDADLLAAHGQHGRVHDPALGLVGGDDDRLCMTPSGYVRASHC